MKYLARIRSDFEWPGQGPGGGLARIGRGLGLGAEGARSVAEKSEESGGGECRECVFRDVHVTFMKN